ncbi:hypothetical protein K502DRAFT_367136 [Neoconidiobolus thromboides FSU 785]|nr:hypothetical protein K502DRAFT_367136 [Neoconidiobolus thromboides FSU 785]
MLAITLSKRNEPKSVQGPKANVQHCHGEIPNNATALEKSLDLNCYVKLETGYCRAAIPGYYYDLKYRECKVNIYGGCAGCVPFDSISECENTCGNKLPKFTEEKKQQLREEEEKEILKKQKEEMERKQKEIEEKDKKLEVPTVPKSETFKQNLKLLEDDIFDSKIPKLPESDPFNDMKKDEESSETVSNLKSLDGDPFAVTEDKEEKTNKGISSGNGRSLKLPNFIPNQPRFSNLPISNIYTNPINPSPNFSNSNRVMRNGPGLPLNLPSPPTKFNRFQIAANQPSIADFTRRERTPFVNRKVRNNRSNNRF